VQGKSVQKADWGTEMRRKRGRKIWTLPGEDEREDPEVEA
jgi:hypothetical protein